MINTRKVFAERNILVIETEGKSFYDIFLCFSISINFIFAIISEYGLNIFQNFIRFDNINNIISLITEIKSAFTKA